MNDSRRYRLLSVGLAALLSLPVYGVRAQNTPAGEESARDLFKRVVDNIPKVPFFAKMTLTNAGTTRELELSHKQLDDKTYGVYLAVTSPQDVAGTRFLLIERTEGNDEQYMRVPQVSRIVRLVSNNRAQQQLLGSEFYVSDLNLPDPDKLDLAFAGNETVGGRNCRLIDVVARPEADWTYKKARYAVDPVDLLIVRGEMADENGPFKLLTLDRLEKIDGIWTPRVQVMKNLRDKVESRLEIREIRYRVELESDLFTRNRLERER